MSADNSALVEDLRGVLEAFVDTLNDRLPAQELEDVLAGRTDDLTSKDLGNKPESFTEDHLIDPLLEAAGIPYESQPYGKAGERDRWPDGELTNVESKVISEHKPLNNVDEAHGQLKDYLDRKSIGAEYGIATDGIEWYLYKIELGGDFTEYPLIEEVNLRQALLSIARGKNYLGSTDAEAVDIDEVIGAFAAVFERDAFDELLSQRAPRELRDARKRDIEEFYELYIELLFGESDEHAYDTCLMDDIDAPPGATEHDERLFAINLMNRLLFIKFLESRDVLPEGFLNERVIYYETNADGLAGNLYETQLEPLFYKLFNTPEEERNPKHRSSDHWFSTVPYLNGGLFRENLPNERQYSVNDRILPVVIRDLIEGSELELNGRGFDPAILGSVFEKTINHIEQERTQKDIGAYYTPNDVTELIIEQSVDPKIRDILIEAVAEESASSEEEVASIRSTLEEYELQEMLRRIEERDGWFGNPEAIERALQELRELKIIDPACGSGHFLTSAMDEIHRAQVSLLRCLSKGDEPTAEERYEEKQRLALNAIYGVDVDDVAAEIAKLRVWLKIVEGNGWEPDFGRLPNIDVNITDGNSLVGLPMTGTFDDVDVWSEDIQEIEQRREEYKEEDRGDPRAMERFMAEEIRPELNQEYLEMYSKPVETEILSVEEFDRICAAIDGQNLYPELEMVRVERADGDAIDDDGSERLEELGFSVYKKSAKVDIQDWESKLKRMDDEEVADHRAHIEDELRRLLEGPYVFSEVQRQPLAYDLNQVLGTPFHWMAEFPEVATENGGRHTIDFDIVLGNPPYGDILGDEEKMFVSTYETAGLSDISATFVERQMQLLDEGGYFGNVTTLRLVYQSDLKPLHDLLRESLSPTRIACFGFRPSRVFENAHVRVAIFTGQKLENGNEGIKSSDLVLFNENNREQRFGNLQFGATEGLLLTDKIGGNGDRGPVLPKVGGETKRAILCDLRDRSDTVFRDIYHRDEPDGDAYILYKRRGVLYWINPMLEELYQSTLVDPVWFDTKLKRDTAFLVLNSSLYFLYWQTYGNQHTHEWLQMGAFPFPPEEAIEEYSEQIDELADELWQRMKQTFSKSRDNRGDFFMSTLRPMIDDVDLLISDLYGLTTEQTEFATSYLTDLGEGSARAGKGNEDIRYESIF